MLIGGKLLEALLGTFFSCAIIDSQHQCNQALKHLERSEIKSLFQNRSSFNVNVYQIRKLLNDLGNEKLLLRKQRGLEDVQLSLIGRLGLREDIQGCLRRASSFLLV